MNLKARHPKELSRDEAHNAYEFVLNEWVRNHDKIHMISYLPFTKYEYRSATPNKRVFVIALACGAVLGILVGLWLMSVELIVICSGLITLCYAGFLVIDFLNIDDEVEQDLIDLFKWFPEFFPNPRSKWAYVRLYFLHTNLFQSHAQEKLYHLLLHLRINERAYGLESAEICVLQHEVRLLAELMMLFGLIDQRFFSLMNCSILNLLDKIYTPEDD